MTQVGYTADDHKYVVPKVGKMWKPPVSADEVNLTGIEEAVDRLNREAESGAFCPDCRGHGGHHPDCIVPERERAERAGFVCCECGERHFGLMAPSHVATWHHGVCDICGLHKYLTEPRDFGTLNPRAKVESTPQVEVESCPTCGAVEDIDYGQSEGVLTVAQHHLDAAAALMGIASSRLPGKVEDGAEAVKVPLWKQALWLARHIEDLHSPRPEVVSDDQLRGMTLVRVLGIGADEHGDDVFHKSIGELARDRAEEWSDAEFYDLVQRYGDEVL